MTVLDIATACCKRLQLTVPVTFIGSTDNNYVLLLAMIERTAQEIRNEFAWPELQSEHTFTLATNTASYALPGDFDRFQFETLWNRTQHWPLIGPVDAVMWQNYKSGLITTLPRQRFRVKSWSNTQFFIDPTPTSGENGQTCVYEYINRTMIKPKTWTASTSWTGLRYCSYNGYIFDRGSAGAATTGTSAPTPSSLNDGSIVWTLYTSPYESFNYDSDNVILDNEMVIDGSVWRFKQERGLDFEDLRAQAEDQKEMAKSRLDGADVLSVSNRQRFPSTIGWWSYPEANYGI